MASLKWFSMASFRVNYGFSCKEKLIELFFVVGIECLDPEIVYPGVYTNVAYYLTWILDNMIQ